MKAVRYHGIGDVRTEYVADPVPRQGEVLLRILYGGICGSDLHIYRKGMFVEKIPEIMGHEFVARVVKAPGDSGYYPGDLVTGDPRVPCGKCQACQSGEYQRCALLGFIGEVSPGAFAEFLAISPEKLVKFNEEIEEFQGALAEPLAVAVHACRRITKSGPSSVLVMGAGPIGLLVASLLKQVYGIGWVDIADIDGYRRRMARHAGVDHILEDLEGVHDQYDTVCDVVGLEVVLGTALQVVKPGGQVHVTAIYERLPVTDVNLLVGKEITLVGNNAYTMEDLREAAAMIDKGTVDFSWMISRIQPAEEACDAFESLVARDKKDLKILLSFDR